MASSSRLKRLATVDLTIGDSIPALPETITSKRPLILDLSDDSADETDDIQMINMQEVSSSTPLHQPPSTMQQSSMLRRSKATPSAQQPLKAGSKKRASKRSQLHSDATTHRSFAQFKVTKPDLERPKFVNPFEKYSALAKFIEGMEREAKKHDVIDLTMIDANADVNVTKRVAMISTPETARKPLQEIFSLERNDEHDSLFVNDAEPPGIHPPTDSLSPATDIPPATTS